LSQVLNTNPGREPGPGGAVMVRPSWPDSLVPHRDRRMVFISS
jgi:hypothetical protein